VSVIFQSFKPSSWPWFELR